MLSWLWRRFSDIRAIDWIAVHVGLWPVILGLALGCYTIVETVQKGYGWWAVLLIALVTFALSLACVLLLRIAIRALKPPELPGLGSLSYVSLIPEVRHFRRSQRTNVQLKVELKNNNKFMVHFKAQISGEVNGKAADPLKFNGFVPANETRYLILAWIDDVPVDSAGNAPAPILSGNLHYDVRFWSTNSAPKHSRRTSRTCVFELMGPLFPAPPEPGVEMREAGRKITVLLRDEIEE